MDAFWCITLSVLIIRHLWKNKNDQQPDHSRRNTVKDKWSRKAKLETDKEIITVVIPTIKGGQ